MAMWRYLKIVNPVPLPNRITTIEEQKRFTATLEEYVKGKLKTDYRHKLTIDS